MRGRRREKTGGASAGIVEAFSGRERHRCLQIVWRSRMALLGQTLSPNYSRIPTAAADPLARRSFSRSVSSTDCKYACVTLTCEKPTGTDASWRWAGEMRGFGLSRFAAAFMNNRG